MASTAYSPVWKCCALERPGHRDRPADRGGQLDQRRSSRFAPAMIASGVYAGVFDLEYGLSREDKAGVSIGQALQQIGYAGPHPVGGQAVQAAYELHIEQGPILEAQDLTIGVVTGAQGQRWYEVERAGAVPCRHHAHGSTAWMHCGFCPGGGGGQQIVPGPRREGRATVAWANIFPNSRNVVPGGCFSGRVPPSVKRCWPCRIRQTAAAVARIAEGIGCRPASSRSSSTHRLPSTKTAGRVQAAAEALGYSHRRCSGAGHDAIPTRSRRRR